MGCHMIFFFCDACTLHTHIQRVTTWFWANMHRRNRFEMCVYAATSKRKMKNHEKKKHIFSAIYDLRINTQTFNILLLSRFQPFLCVLRTLLASLSLSLCSCHKCNTEFEASICLVNLLARNRVRNKFNLVLLYTRNAAKTKQKNRRNNALPSWSWIRIR